MPKFVDRDNREWAVEVTVGDLKWFREDYGIDLKEAGKGKLGKLGEAIADPETLVQVLYRLCETQAEKLDVTPEAFGKAMTGGALRQAAVAFIGAVFDFSQGPTAAREMEEAVRAAMGAMDNKIGQAVASLSQTVQSRITAGNWAELSASTPEDSHTANSI